MSDIDPSDIDAALAADERMRIARQGLSLEADKNSEFCRYIMAKAESEAAQATVELIACDAAETDRVRKLQWQIRRHLDLETWINEAIEAGLEAADAIRAEDDNV